MFILGVTGGIATGKSTVCHMFQDRGAVVVDADGIARTLLRPGTELSGRVARAFPEYIAAGTVDTIDRRALGDRILRDSDARKDLERLMHPAIVAELTAAIDIARNRSDAGLTAVEIPLLYEVGLELLVDGALVVSCSEVRQVERLRERLKIDDAVARAYIAAQMPISEKIARADHIITTDGTLAETEEQVDVLARRLAG